MAMRSISFRADGALWIDDCTRDKGNFPQNATRLLTMTLLPRNATCRNEKLNRANDQLYCDFPDQGADNLLWNLQETPI